MTNREKCEIEVRKILSKFNNGFPLILEIELIEALLKREEEIDRLNGYLDKWSVNEYQDKIKSLQEKLKVAREALITIECHGNANSLDKTIAGQAIQQIVEV